MSTENTSIKFLLGKFRTPEAVAASVTNLQSQGIKVYDVYSPFPIHGMEKLLGFKRSRLTVAAFFFGDELADQVVQAGDGDPGPPRGVVFVVVADVVEESCAGTARRGDHGETVHHGHPDKCGRRCL